MKTLLRLFTLFVFVIALLTFTTPARQAAAQNALPPCGIFEQTLTAGQQIGPFLFTVGDYLVTYLNGSVNDVYTVPATGLYWYTAGPAGTYLSFKNTGCFNPQDNRADPRPGDHLAVYCGQTTIQVIVIDPHSVGVGIVKFNPVDVLKAGKAGLTAKLGGYGNNRTITNLGTISIQMVDSNGRTYFYIAWNGGVYHPTGQGDYSKQFSSPIATCPYYYQ